MKHSRMQSASWLHDLRAQNADLAAHPRTVLPFEQADQLKDMYIQGSAAAVGRSTARVAQHAVFIRRLEAASA
jgi:hypothetical protein